MKRCLAEYFAELLTFVTNGKYVVEASKEGGNNYYAYQITKDGDKLMQTRGRISTKLEDTIRRCKNGLAHL